MNKLIFSFLIVITYLTIGYAQESVAINHNSANIWQQDFSKAEKLTKSADKPLLIFFTGSDWCGPCKMLVSDVFESDKFKEEVQNDFILYEADFPRNKDLVTNSQRSDNYKLKNKYNVSSYPTIVIVNEKGKALGKMKGYNLMRDTSYHYKFFDDILKDNE
ncbi:thioredoxin family protein [Lutibacter sp.]|uniref:thioredoxin family protein n=1 Tax=Lutibacter sp. TaxID=1925666 RepID=UPI0034A0ADAE